MRIFSGIQPTGRKHLGNYIGAIVQYVASQERGEGIFCIVDLHAITVPYEAAELPERCYDTAAILLAAGLDPERCIFFRQSDVPEHTELSWTAWFQVIVITSFCSALPAVPPVPFAIVNAVGLSASTSKDVLVPVVKPVLLAVSV